MIIKIISLWQPWAWAMWDGLKKYETRSESAPVVAQLNKYRGWLGIHAAKRRVDVFEHDEDFLNMLAKRFDGSSEWHAELEGRFHEAMHYGCIGGVARFDGGIYSTQSVAHKLDETELALGDYTPGRRAIHCPYTIPLEVPVPVRGHQGLFNWEVWPEVEALLREAIA